jgi:hypothetical protein
MPLNAEDGKRMLQLLTSRYDDRHWRKKIEKTLSLPPTGVSEEVQRAIFVYLKQGLKAYKSFRADPDSWIVGGYATREVVDRAKFNPAAVGPGITKEDVAALGQDPGTEVDATWWEDMLVAWFEEPEEEGAEEPKESKEDGSTGEAAEPANKKSGV